MFAICLCFGSTLCQDEDREFRERYLSADKETEPDWKQKMDQAKTKEDRFKVGLQVGDFKTRLLG